MIKDFKFKEKYGADDLVEIMRILRTPEGCPWDREQDHQSIKKNFIEETYEVIEAINKNDAVLLCEELGDVMMQVVFHAQIESEKGSFDFDDVCDGVCKKLIIRHPHVFADGEAKTSDDVLVKWDEIKKKTKSQETQTSVMRSVPRELPALMRAEKVRKKAKGVDIDSADLSGAFDKIDEETQQLRKAAGGEDKNEIAARLGDLLFSVVRVAGLVGADPEEALTDSTDRFIDRFEKAEKLANKG
ncbi:MAG: nucleoside triphosphate pyrophosphohydrolase [Oscillospiraceae bacterium]|nr:nucleoside triphosphate pyrophosphohydrolase [Oscillospiraceae bacterium]